MKDLYRFLKLKWSDIEGTAQRLGISPKFVVRDVLLAWTQDRLVSADCAAYGGYSANSTYIPRGYARLSRDLDIKMDFRRYSKPDVAIRELNAALEDRGDVLDLEYRGYVVRVGEVVPNPGKVGAGLRADVQLIFLRRSMLSPYVGMSFSTWLSRHEIYSNYPPEVRQGLLRKFKEVFGPEARIHEIDIDVCLEAPEVIQESEVVSARPVTADVPFTLTCRILRPELLEESYRNAFLNFLQRLETRNLVKTVIDLQVTFHTRRRDPEFADLLKQLQPLLTNELEKVVESEKWILAPLGSRYKDTYATIIRKIIRKLKGSEEIAQT